MRIQKMNKDKVLHIITCLGRGGAQNTLANICLQDIKKRHVVVTLTGGEFWATKLAEYGIKVVDLSVGKSIFGLGFLFFKLLKVIKSENPSVIQTWMYHADLLGGVAGRLAGFENVCWNIRHSDLRPGVEKRSTIWTMRLCAILSDIIPARIICCSQEAVRVHRQYGYSAEKLIFLPNGVDGDRYFWDRDLGLRTRARMGLQLGAPVCLSIGRDSRQKGRSVLFEAFAAISRSDAVLVLVGDGLVRENSTLLRQVELHNLSERVVFLGPSDNVPDLLRMADLYIQSSISGEGYPNALAEACVTGVACVASDVGDSRAILAGYPQGVVCEPGSSESLAKAIDSALVYFDDWTEGRMGDSSDKAPIKTVFDVSEMIRRYHLVWEDL